MSADVLKLSMSRKLGPTVPWVRRSQRIWRAMKSRKVSPSLTGMRDLAFSKPMPVPSPPFNLITQSLSSRAGSGAAGGMSDNAGTPSAGAREFSGISPASPEAAWRHARVKLARAAGDKPADSIFCRAASSPDSFMTAIRLF